MSFKDLYSEDNRPKIALFYGPNCAPCNSLKPKLREACADLNVDLHEFNAGSEREAVMLLGIRAVPTVVLVRGNSARIIMNGDQTSSSHIRLQLVAQGVAIQ